MTNQRQNVGDGASAYQSFGDLTVNQGATPSQMAEIIGAISAQIANFTSIAHNIAEDRCNRLKEEIIQKLSEENSERKQNSFKDPDFQFILGKAFGGFARNGEEELKDQLINLLMARSERQSRDRMSLIINQAIELAPLLTDEDKSILVCLFVVKNVVVTSQSISAIYARYQNFLEKFTRNLSEKITSFEYLESIGCITINRVADHFPLAENFFSQYGKLFSQGHVTNILSGQYNPNAVEAPSTPEGVWQSFMKAAPALAELDRVWNSSFYRHSTPTAAGRALAHSLIAGHGHMDAALEVFFN